MMRLVLCLVLALGASASGAQDLPALFDVDGVAADDVLNVRAAPDAGAAIVGSLSPDAAGVEVTAIDGGWARVNSGERSGWAALGYLSTVPGGTFPRARGLRCFGTEPFWSLRIVQEGAARYESMEGAGLDLMAGAVLPGANVPDRFGLFAAGPAGSAAVSLRRENCSDGMSDRLYGLSAEVILGGGMSAVLSGCCSVTAP